MNKSMMDILACPIDKTHPLELHQIKEKDSVVSEGVLVCTKCSRFFPIIEEIPIMLPDELRDKKLEI
ncbi:MAG: Trm112 family protein, partial [Nitrosopumilaceae archaeon]|nr:Trm112 family protein [Nitrosopumilaceae archaeon]